MKLSNSGSDRHRAPPRQPASHARIADGDPEAACVHETGVWGGGQKVGSEGWWRLHEASSLTSSPPLPTFDRFPPSMLCMPVVPPPSTSRPRIKCMSMPIAQDQAAEEEAVAEEPAAEVFLIRDFLLMYGEHSEVRRQVLEVMEQDAHGERIFQELWETSWAPGFQAYDDEGKAKQAPTLLHTIDCSLSGVAEKAARRRKAAKRPRRARRRAQRPPHRRRAQPCDQHPPPLVA